ncbi:MAG: hypothetical protein AAFN40_19755 [Cyanobacteria bacterium J06560_6]
MVSGVPPGAALMSTLFASCAIALIPTAAYANPQAPTGPMDLPGRPPVDPIEFPTETPAAPVSTPASHEEESHEEESVDASLEVPVDEMPTGGDTEGVATEADLPPVETDDSTDETVEEARAESVSVPWRKFTNEAGQFRVAMPSQPARYSLGSAAGIDDSQMYMQLQLVDGAYLEIYAAAFVESASFARSQANPESALLECVAGLGDLPERSEPNYLASRRERGVEMTFRGDDGAFQVSRCYLVGDRAYMLTVSRESFDAGAGLIPLNEVAPQTMPVRSAGMDVFFDSFEVLD